MITLIQQAKNDWITAGCPEVFINKVEDSHPPSYDVLHLLRNFLELKAVFRARCGPELTVKLYQMPVIP